MKKVKSVFRTLCAQTLVVSLVQLHTTQLAYAINMDDADQAVSILGGIGQNIFNQKKQLAEKAMADAYAQNIQKQLQPKLGPSKYFPECQLPQAMQPVPQNACMPSNNPQQLASVYGYEKAATNMVNYFDQMLNEVTRAPIGVSCMSNQKKLMDAQMTEMINNLTRLQTQLKEESQQFRENNKGLISDLEETNAELMGTTDGGSAKNNLNTKTKDFSKIVTPDCQKVLGNALSAASQVGFNGLLQSLGPKNQAANDYSSSRGQMETEIKAQVQKLKDSIATNGLENWATLDANGIGRGQIDLSEKLSSYPSLATIMNKERANLQSQSLRIGKALAALKYEIPKNLDKELSSELANKISSVQSDLKKEYISDCTISSKQGVAIDIESVIGSVEQISTGNSPMAINSYKTAFQNIMNSDDSLTVKLEKIKSLEGAFKGMTVSYTDFNGSKTTETPYSLLTKTKANCENKYEEVGASNGKSVQALLKEFKNLTDSFPSTLGNNIVNTMINCNGEALKSTDTCNEDSLNPAKQQSFCMAKATTCANKMNACYSEINTQVEKRKTKINATAKQFNANVAQMVARANSLFKAQTNNIEKLTKLIQQRFPGSNFEIPKDLFISLPETTKDKFGVDLAGNGDINKIIAELPGKIDSLKEMFGNQKLAADAEMDEYIGKVKSNIAAEKSKFQALASSCKSAASATENNIAQAENAKQKAQAELDQKVGKFCRKYDRLRSSPVPACDKAKDMTDEIDGIIARLSKKSIRVAQAYENHCAQFNNGSEEIPDSTMCDGKTGTDLSSCRAELKLKLERASSKRTSTAGTKPGKKSAITAAALCPKDTTNDKFIDNVISKLPESERKNLPGIKDGMQVNKKKILAALKSGSYEEFGSDEGTIQSIMSEYSITFDEKNSKSICEAILGTATKKTEDSEETKKLKTALETAQAAVKESVKDSDTEKLAALNLKVTQADAAYKASQEKDKSAATASAASLTSSNDEKLAALFLDQSSTTASDDTWKQIGQQDTSSCDVELNSSLAKNPLSFDIDSYDKNRTSGGRAQ